MHPARTDLVLDCFSLIQRLNVAQQRSLPPAIDRELQSLRVASRFPDVPKGVRLWENQAGPASARLIGGVPGWAGSFDFISLCVEWAELASP